MDRVFLESSCVANGRATIEGPRRRHLADALRVRVGDRFLATDGEGRELLLEAETVDRRTIVAAVVHEERRPPRAAHRVSIALAPPKGGRMETAIEKIVECGIGRIVPLQTSRSVVKGRDDSERMERWRRVAQSATAQSGRNHVAEITRVMTIAEALGERPTRALLAHPEPNAPTVMQAVRGVPGDVLILVGPEGGFADEEVEEARRLGATAVSLGPTRLRSETAAIVAAVLAVASLTTDA
jgi:16S rRNA (uracil1498-N3)-methyltransferase